MESQEIQPSVPLDAPPLDAPAASGQPPQPAHAPNPPAPEPAAALAASVHVPVSSPLQPAAQGPSAAGADSSSAIASHPPSQQQTQPAQQPQAQPQSESPSHPQPQSEESKQAAPSSQPQTQAPQPQTQGPSGADAGSADPSAPLVPGPSADSALAPTPATVSAPPVQRVWCSGGYGVLESTSSEGIATVRLGWGAVLYAPRVSMLGRVRLRVRSFHRGNAPSDLYLTAEVSGLWAPVPKKVAELAGVKEEEVRLLHKGREIRCGGSEPFAAAGIAPPWELLLIHDEKSRFIFDRRNCGEDISVLNEGLAATIGSEGKWRTVRGSTSLRKGRHYWDVRLDQCTSGNMFLGVCTESAPLNNYCGNDDNGVGYYGCSNVYRRGASKRYGEAYRTGDTIRVKLDLERRTLSFAKNGVELGVAVEDLPEVLFPAFSLYSRDDKLTLTAFGTFDA